MIDHRLRAAKDRAVEPVTSRLPDLVTPGRLTAASVVAGVVAGVLAAIGWRWWSLAVWLVGRVLDGIDGALARHLGRHSDLGGYFDLMGDTVGYAAVPVGIAAAHGDTGMGGLCGAVGVVLPEHDVVDAAVGDRREAQGRRRHER